MSRTIRRTKTKKPYSRLERNYTHKPLPEWLDVEDTSSYRPGGVPVRKLEGAEFLKVYWKFHTDNGCREFGFENCFERPQRRSSSEVRGHFKRELEKWKKDDEYEVILQAPKGFWEYP